MPEITEKSTSITFNLRNLSIPQRCNNNKYLYIIINSFMIMLNGDLGESFD